MSKFIIKSIGKAINATSLVSPKYASKKALGLFATPRKGRYSEAQRQSLSTANFEILKYENFNIATYHWPGNNKTILLASWLGKQCLAMELYVRRFKAQDYNIIALDAPAHGNSSGRQFNAVLYSEFINVVAKNINPKYW